MSRKVTLILAAAASLAVATLASNASYARGGFGFGGGGGFGRSMSHNVSLNRGSGLKMARTQSRLQSRTIRHDPPTKVSHWHHHWRWAFRGGRWIEVDNVVDETPIEVAPAVNPAPCSCLTKTYTPTGLVVFADICTKESASAPAIGDTADAAQAPTTPVPATATPMSQVPTVPNYAGRTYQDFLAANPQFAQPQASSAAPQQN